MNDLRVLYLINFVIDLVTNAIRERSSPNCIDMMLLLTLFYRDQTHCDLGLPDVLAMHKEMAHYDDWIKEAPDYYTDDGFMSTHIPIMVTSHYGQNQLLGSVDVQTVQWWQCFRKLKHIRFICTALASDIRHCST
jgi:hypothetical protein